MLLLYFQHQREPENCPLIPYYLANWFCTHACLNITKSQQHPDQNHCSHQKNTSAKTSEHVASALAYDVVEICKRLRNSVKFAPTVAHGNS